MTQKSLQRKTWSQISVEIHLIKVSFGALLPMMNKNGRDVLLFRKEIPRDFGATKALNIEVNKPKLEVEDNAKTGKINRHINIPIYQNTLSRMVLRKTIAEIQ